MLGGGVDAATLVAALGAGPPPHYYHYYYYYYWQGATARGGGNGRASGPATYTTCLVFLDRLSYKRDTRTHAPGTDLGGGLVERVRVRRHWGLLCSKRVAAVSCSICILLYLLSLLGRSWVRPIYIHISTHFLPGSLPPRCITPNPNPALDPPPPPPPPPPAPPPPRIYARRWLFEVVRCSIPWPFE